MATENSTTAGTPVFEVSWTEVRAITKTHRLKEIAIDADDAERRAKQTAGFSWSFLEQHLARLGWASTPPIEPADASDLVAALREIVGQEHPNPFGFDAASIALDDGWRSRARAALAKVES